MYLTENMELLETLVAGGHPAPWPPGGEGRPGGRGAAKKIKLMDSGVSHQVKQGYDIKRPCSAVHLTTLLHHDLLQRS